MPDTVMTNVYLPSGPGAADSMEYQSLRDVVELIAIDDTPLWSNVKKTTARALKEEWGEQGLGTIPVAAARSLGFVAAPSAPIKPARLDNWTQLIADEGGVSDTEAELEAAGDSNTYEGQALLKGIRLRRSGNKMLHTSQIKVASTATPVMATPKTYVQAANFFGTATTPGVAGAGDGTTLPTQGTTPEAFNTIGDIDTVLLAGTAGSMRPDTIYFSPRNKKSFSKLPDASIASNTQTTTAGNPAPFVHVGAVDRYLSDFGMMETVMDIDAPNTDVFLLNHDCVDMPVFPGLDFAEDELGRRGSGREFMVQWQGTFRVLNRGGLALITGYLA